jgi:cell division septal protein FtsQ
VDPFVVIIFGGVAGLVIALLLLGWLAPGSGAQQLDWRPTRSVAVEVQNEIDDLDQMLEAANARRRAKGLAELSPAAYRAQLERDRR